MAAEGVKVNTLPVRERTERLNLQSVQSHGSTAADLTVSNEDPAGA